MKRDCKRASKGHALRRTASAAMLAAISFGANAQSSVQLYGIVDAGVVVSNRGNGQKSLTQLQSGLASGSRWGLRGIEDLGGGYKAVFALEAGFDADTGVSKNFQPNPSSATPTSPNGTTTAGGFNRRSFVGLETPIGEFHFGRDYTPFFYAGLKPDILSFGLFGNTQSIASLTGTVERWVRFSNGVNYVSPNLSGFKARAVYSLGENTGAPGSAPRDASKMWGVGGEYSNAGLDLSVSYQSLRLANTAGTPLAFTGSTTTVNDWLVGGRYTFGPAAVSAGYWKGGEPWRAQAAWVGASYTFGVNTVSAQVQRYRQKNAAGADREASVLGLAYTHLLSKRTTLYASVGRVSNNATSAVTLLSADVGVPAAAPGADPRALGFGIRHVF